MTTEGLRGGSQPPMPGRIRAFGLDLELGFPVPGIEPAPGARGVPAPVRRRVRLELAQREELERGWRPTAPERISTRRLPDGREAVTIDADERAGHLIRALGFGRFWISPGATLVRCAPLRVPAWRWQRYLIGQVLPLTAVLRGFEVFHASAVALGGRALTCLGASTAGKTSLAVNLVLRGARFMTDDVLAVSANGAGVTAHAGAALASVRHDAADLLAPQDRRRLGRTVGRDGDAQRIRIERREHDSPLWRAYLLRREPEGSGLAIERLSPVDPRLLLGGSFNFIVRTPERLENQLDLCARLAATAEVFRTSVPPSVGAAELAEAIEHHAGAEGS